MTFASIMVAMDLTTEARDRVRLAGHLADEFRARLIGVAAETPAYAVPPVGPTPASAYALTASNETVLNDLRQAHAAFEEAAGNRSRVEWRSNIELPLPFLVAQAAAAEQQVPGSTEGIRYQDGSGQWHDETAQGSDRPVARVAED